MKNGTVVIERNTHNGLSSGIIRGIKTRFGFVVRVAHEAYEFMGETYPAYEYQLNHGFLPNINTTKSFVEKAAI